MNGRDSASGIAQHDNETLVWNGRVWRAVSARPTLQRMISVACATSSDCWGVGSKLETRVTADFAEHWNGRTWTSAHLPVGRGQELPDIEESIGLASVTCSASADCWAVGSALPRGAAQYGTVLNEALHWNGSTWRLVKTPNPNVRDGPAPAEQFLSAVSCTAATNCWAVGHYTTYDHKTHTTEIAHAQILHWDGKTWAHVSS